MARFQSKIESGTPEFEAKQTEMSELLDSLAELNLRAGILSEKRRATFDKRGQLLPRERLARLLDPGMPFLRMHSLAGYMIDTKKEEKSIPGSSTIAGIGFTAPWLLLALLITMNRRVRLLGSLLIMKHLNVLISTSSW